MRFVAEADREAFGQAIAHDETPARTGYADARAVFAGALAEARMAVEPLSLSALTDLVRKHAKRAAFYGAESDARYRWGERVARIGTVRPSMGRTRGLAALAALAKGAL